ncbi:hypothetical protein KKB40_01235 [Patescibacteria group bacterium]|nr:hypothetical protein [Patescibacteria group bacterium]
MRSKIRMIADYSAAGQGYVFVDEQDLRNWRRYVRFAEIDGPIKPLSKIMALTDLAEGNRPTVLGPRRRGRERR